MTVTGSGPQGHITRDDIQAKLGELEGSAEAPMERAKSSLLVAGVVVVGVVVVAAYLIGRRRGRKRSTILEIRRT